MDNDNSEMINPTVTEETVNTPISPNNQNQYEIKHWNKSEQIPN